MRPSLPPAGPWGLPSLLLGALAIAVVLLSAPSGVQSAAAAGCPSPAACRSRPEPEPDAERGDDRHDDRAERVSRRSIGGLGPGLGRGKADQIAATSEAPAALPLTLLPSSAPSLRWPPEDEGGVSGALLAIPLLPPANGGPAASLAPGATTATFPTAAPGQLAHRSGSRPSGPSLGPSLGPSPPAGADAAGEADVWFPDSVRRPPVTPESNRGPVGPDLATKWPSDSYDVTKRPSDHYDVTAKRPGPDHYRATDDGGWGQAEQDGDRRAVGAIEPYWGQASGQAGPAESSGRRSGDYYRPHGYLMTTRRAPARHRNATYTTYATTRRPSNDLHPGGYWQGDAAWGATTRRPSDNSYHSGDHLSPGKLAGTRQQHLGPNKQPWSADGGRATTPNPGSGWRPGAGPGRPGSISRRKCEEYARLQTEKVVALPLVPEPRPSVQQVQKCDANSVPLVVGGKDVRLNEFPHMAAIGYRGPGTKVEWNCGGSLISELFVLTAAHCTATAQGPPIRVRLGEHNLESTEDGARHLDVAVSSMVRHPDYAPPARYHDIGLLRLARRVAFSAAIRPACLHAAAEGRDDEDEGLAAEPLIAVGWGYTEQLGERSQVLQKVLLDFVDHSTCKALYAADASTSSLSRGIVGETQLCAGALEGGRDTCQGDSGGPLQISSRDNRCVFHIVGITSFGKVCAARNAPGVYTRVSRYIPWIERHVWPEERS